jgi:uncharacterized protein
MPAKPQDSVTNDAVSSIEPRVGKRRIQMRVSNVHGRGVFATILLPKDSVIIEYKGEIIDWEEAIRRHPHDPNQPNHTFYFDTNNGLVIDGRVKGNLARWINHACKPNCEADEINGRVFIKALTDIKAGQELFYNYGLSIDARYTAKLKKAFACHCGFKGCTGTLLAPKRS